MTKCLKTYYKDTDKAQDLVIDKCSLEMEHIYYESNELLKFFVYVVRISDESLMPNLVCAFHNVLDAMAFVQNTNLFFGTKETVFCYVDVEAEVLDLIPF